MDDLATYAENTWCPGCGNFGILNAVKKALISLETKGVPRERIVMTAGIGQHAKIFDYLWLSGFYGLHGRSMATAQGIKLANPDLKVVDFGGDGDSFGEGIEHMIFAAKRNSDITVICHNNGVYALTTGQMAPTSERGYRGPSTPGGNVEDPLNPLSLMLEAGATFVARGYSGKPAHLADLVVQAVEHEGFSFIDVLQPCVTFHDTFKEYNRMVEVLEQPVQILEEAVRQAKRTDRLPIGVLWQVRKIPYHREILGDANLVRMGLTREERMGKIEAYLSVRS
jgi:2-oxoglutarate ferredoxin oxidoreductase subunit beta